MVHGCELLAYVQIKYILSFHSVFPIHLVFMFEILNFMPSVGVIRLFIYIYTFGINIILYSIFDKVGQLAAYYQVPLRHILLV